MAERDIRLDMEFDKPIPTPHNYCSVCGVGSVLRDDLMLTKHHRSNAPLGHLMTRCPEHQSRYESARG